MLKLNVETARDGDILPLKVGLSQDSGRSRSGGSNTAAKTGGFIAVPGRDGGGAHPVSGTC